MQKDSSGKLYVVATPIGNLQDITLRAIAILKSVDKIAVEDTRHATVLLNHFSIKKPTISLHEHNERERVDGIIRQLEEGENVALVSDAGTPLISDPGYHLVREVRERGFTVIPVPGPCAAIAALSAAGLPTNRFCFEGFLPAKQEACRKRLQELTSENRTMIFYETPHRFMSVLAIMLEVWGEDREVVVARELTKLHESIISAKLKDVYAHYEKNSNEVRGEFVICVSGVAREEKASEMASEKVLDILLTELPVKQAAALASKITGERKNYLYELALQKQGLRKET